MGTVVIGTSWADNGELVRSSLYFYCLNALQQANLFVYFVMCSNKYEHVCIDMC